MTDNDSNKDNASTPPKIRLTKRNSGGSGEQEQQKKEATAPIRLTPPDASAPPKLTLKRPPTSSRIKITPPASMSPEEKKATARLSLSEAKPVEEGAVPAASEKPDAPQTPSSSKEAAPEVHMVEEDESPFTDLDEGTAEAMKHRTMRIDDISPEDLAGTATKKPAMPPTMVIRKKRPPTAVDSPREVAAKSSTMRIDAIKDESLEDVYKAALNATQRVILEDKEKDTQAIQLEKSETDALSKLEQTQAEKRTTARVNLAELGISDGKSDDAKHQTIPIQSTAPGSMAPTQLKRSAGETMPVPDLSSAQKSETSRIDASDTAPASPPSQRKTIRIKRPDGSTVGGTRPMMSVARKSGSGTSLTLKKPGGTSAEPATVTDDAIEADELVMDEAGSPVFASLALVATLISFGVIYVLLAILQETIPFPGRLIG